MAKRIKSEPPQVAVQFCDVAELTDQQLQTFIDVGRRQGELLTRLRQAVRDGDRVRAWELAVELYSDWERPLAPAA
jgi:hypothetical protein